ncbi:unnamed protein product [Brassica rapa]|uniref:Uncharacterized protein n=1 Tax=Brassica campestris TaxID=3711 RepID=A0A8D9MHD5_BRACM|nr:unnamed protein product [Brassica rapa]
MLSLKISPPLLPFCESSTMEGIRSQKRTGLHEEALALYCLREMTIIHYIKVFD